MTNDFNPGQSNTSIDSETDHQEEPLTPNLAYYATPGAFGTSLPGMVAPAIVETARENGQPPHRSTEDDTDFEPWTTGNTDDDIDVNGATSEGDEDLPLDDSIPNSAYSSAPNRVFEAGRKNTRSNAAADYDDTPRQSSGNIAAEHLLAHTAPGAQAETDRRIFGGEPVMDSGGSDDRTPGLSEAGENDEAETPAD